MEHEKPAQIRGKTIRLTWTEGPTKGTTHEHMFHEDGTVEWHSNGHDKPDKASSAATDEAPKRERPPYASFVVADDACMVSYLSKSGYTLTVALQFADRSVVGIVSNDRMWLPVRGNFEVVGHASP